MFCHVDFKTNNLSELYYYLGRRIENKIQIYYSFQMFSKIMFTNFYKLTKEY